MARSDIAPRPLLSLGTWMGTETGYVSGHGMYFLGLCCRSIYVL